jgi:predicted pyridoxine 5'-phosphate oxidase superfamily flavin-nucleotide-binding protein
MTPAVMEFIREQKLGFVATVCPDGTPNLSPKGTTRVWDSDHLVFADICSPGTIDNLKINSAIEINMVDVFTRKGYRLKGVARIISEGMLFEEIKTFYGEPLKKYSINNFVLVNVKRVIEITSPVYDTGTSAQEVRNNWIEYWNSIHPHP